VFFSLKICHTEARKSLNLQTEEWKTKRVSYHIDAVTFSKLCAYIIERLQRLFSDLADLCYHCFLFLEMKQFSKSQFNLRNVIYSENANLSIVD